MGTPREYGFNDVSKQNILKADPLSLLFFSFSFFFSFLAPQFFFSFYIFSGRPRFGVTPFSRQVVLVGVEGRTTGRGHNTS